MLILTRISLEKEKKEEKDLIIKMYDITHNDN